MFGHDYWALGYFDDSYWGDAAVSIGGGGSDGKLITTGKITVITIVD